MTIQEKYARYKLTALSDSLIDFWCKHYDALPKQEKEFYSKLLKNKYEKNNNSITV